MTGREMVWRPGDRARGVDIDSSSGRPEALELTLDALCRQSVSPAEFEVVVADDGATPPLAGRLIEPYAERLALRSLLERVGPRAARNAAPGRCRPLLVFWMTIARRIPAG